MFSQQGKGGSHLLSDTAFIPYSKNRTYSMSADKTSDIHLATCCCGALSVSFEGPPPIHFWCHCKDCQKWFGGFDVAEVLWPARDCSFRVLKGKGVDSIFSFTGNSERHFCKVGCFQTTCSTCLVVPSLCSNVPGKPPCATPVTWTNRFNVLLAGTLAYKQYLAVCRLHWRPVICLQH